MIIEITDLGIKPECVDRLKEMIPPFRQILLSLPGGIDIRCLQDEADPLKFCFLMQWDSMDAKDVFMADPRMQEWAAEFGGMTTSHADRYFNEIR